MIAANEVKAQIDRRGGSGGGQQLSFVDEEDVLVDFDRGEPSGQLLRCRPVRCGSSPNEQTCACEDKGAGGDRGDSRAALECREQCPDNCGGWFVSHRRGGTRQDDRIRGLQCFEPSVHRVVESVGSGDFACGDPADLDLIGPGPCGHGRRSSSGDGGGLLGAKVRLGAWGRLGAGAVCGGVRLTPEDLDGDAEIHGRHPVQRQHEDAVRAGTGCSARKGAGVVTHDRLSV